jgi:hypothetical protein
MHTDLLEADAEPALELCFSSEWLLDAEPDPSGWQVGDLAHEGATELLEYGVPLGEEEASLPVRAWNLGTSSLSRVAAAAAFVPLLAVAEPVFAAPPTGAVVSAPSQPAAVDASVWKALINHRVAITLKDDTTFRGTVLSVANGMLVCARQVDGLMVVVDSAQISFVHVEAVPGAPAPKPPQTGQGLIVLGSILTSLGGGLAIATAAAGTICLDTASDSPYGYGYGCYYTLPLGVSSLVNLAVGIPFLAAGLSKRKRHRAATAASTVSPFVTPGRGGAVAGVGIRF